MKAIKKAVNGTTTTKTTIRPGATKDSTVYFRNEVKDINEKIKKVIPNLPKFISNDKSDNKKSQEMRNLVSEKNKAISNQLRQSNKGKIGYDANGFPKKKAGGSIKAKDGKWMQKVSASIKRRGTAGKCTPITKPGCTGRAKALAKTFKKIAKSNKKK